MDDKNVSGKVTITTLQASRVANAETLDSHPFLKRQNLKDCLMFYKWKD